MLAYLWVALGSALGGVARYWCSSLVAARFGESFPWGTILVNVLGSFVIGFFGTLTSADGRWAMGSETRLFVMVGLCGGYTTFSSFSLQTLDLLRGGVWLAAGANILLSVTLCLVAVWAGYAVATMICQAKGA